MKKLLYLLLFLSCFNLANAQAIVAHDNKVQETGYHQHDGFYLSMSLGPVFGSITDNDIMNNMDMKFNGTGAQFDFKIGGAIAENLILHATLLSSSIASPKVTVGGISVTTTNNVSLGEMMIGGGLTYYIMPANILLSGSIGFGSFTVTNSNDPSANTTTKKGFSMQLKAGKEWWVSKNWGFGVGLTYGKTNLTNSSTGVNEKLDSNRFGITSVRL